MKEDSFIQLITTLQAAAFECDALSVAEAIWLAQFNPDGTSDFSGSASDPRSELPSTVVEQPPPPSRPDPFSVAPRDSNKEPDFSLGLPFGGDRFATIYTPMATRAEEEFIPATAVRVVAGSALPDALALGRAMRPLIRYRTSRFLEVLDEEATAERSADSGRRLTPVFRAVRERLLDVALVVDDSPTMAIWCKTIDAFQQLLERHGAFRDVRRWRLRLTTRPTLVATSGRQTAPQELLDPAGHRLIILLTHGTHSAWTSPEIARWLWLWAAQGPVALAQMLPESLWQNTRLREPTAHVRSIRAAEPNTSLLVNRPWWYDPDGPASLAVPVFCLQAGSVSDWANMLMGVKGTTTQAFLFERPENIDKETPSPKSRSISSERQVTLFQENATPEAFALAGYLSQLEFNLPVMRLVQSAMLGARAQQTQLAEVLLSGLLESVTSQDPARITAAIHDHDRAQAQPPQADTSTDPESTVYRLKQGVRHEMRKRITLDSAYRVMRTLARHIEDRLGEPIDFVASAADADGKLKLPKWARPFAAAGEALARQLGLTPQTAKVAPETAIQPSAYKQPITSAQPPTPAPAQPERGRLFRRTSLMTDSPGSLRRIAWSHDGRHIASCGYNRLIKIRDVETAKETRTLSGHSKTVYSVTWSPDSTQLASGSEDGTLRVWDLATGQSTVLTRRKVSTLATAWSGDGHQIAFGANDGTVGLYEPATATPISTSKAHTGPVHTVAWSPNSDAVASASNDGTVRILTKKESDSPYQISVLCRYTFQLYGLAWSPDGKTIAVAGRDGSIYVHEPSGKLVSTLLGHSAAVTDVSFSRHGEWLASISWDDTVRIWNMRAFSLTQTISVKSPKRFHSGVAFSPVTAAELAVVANSASAVEIWRLDDTAYSAGDTSEPNPTASPAQGSMSTPLAQANEFERSDLAADYRTEPQGNLNRIRLVIVATQQPGNEFKIVVGDGVSAFGPHLIFPDKLMHYAQEASFAASRADWKRLRLIGTFLSRTLFNDESREWIIEQRNNIESVVVSADLALADFPWEIISISFDEAHVGDCLADHGLLRWDNSVFGQPKQIEIRSERTYFVGTEQQHRAQDLDLLKKGIRGNFLAPSFDSLVEMFDRDQPDLIHFFSDTINVANDTDHSLRGQEGTSERGFINMLELTRILDRNSRSRKPFVVSTSCGSAGSLGKLFLQSGARIFIGTLWPVEDSAGLAFAMNIYREMSSGISVAEATRKVRRTLKINGDPSWLSFVVFARDATRLSFKEI